MSAPSWPVAAGGVVWVPTACPGCGAPDEQLALAGDERAPAPVMCIRCLAQAPPERVDSAA